MFEPATTATSVISKYGNCPYNPSSTLPLTISLRNATQNLQQDRIAGTLRTKTLMKWRMISASSGPILSGSFPRTIGARVLVCKGDVERSRRSKRVFFLDVNPLCYSGSRPSLQAFAWWISLLFSKVSLQDPVIAVIDGERGNEFRRRILPSYKAHRLKYLRQSSALMGYPGVSVERSHEVVINALRNCNIPVLKVEDHEADDVVATLVGQVLQKGYKVVIASPDKDFKQLISDDVQLAIPIPELQRWSFYTLKHYMNQYNCDPCSDLSLRCIMGDKADGVPGIQMMVPGFGQKTAIKLLKKHGSLENLLNAAAVRTVGKQYAQDALTKYADHLRKNYQVLALKRDVDVHLQDDWLSERDTSNDSATISGLYKSLGNAKKPSHRGRSQSSNK